MKICLDCKTEKPFEDYYSSVLRNKVKYQSYCKPCANKRRVSNLKSVKQEAFDYLGGMCDHCSIKEPLCIFDFHHLDPSEKDFTINRKKSQSLKSLKKELDKCIILCANCHRIEHSK